MKGIEVFHGSYKVARHAEENRRKDVLVSGERGVREDLSVVFMARKAAKNAKKIFEKYFLT